MSQPINNQYNTVGTPIYNYPETNTFKTNQGQTVSVVPQGDPNAQIYQYPTTSLYEPAKQASGVNIIINNPSGYSAGGVSSVPYPYPYPVNVQQPTINNPGQTTIANTPISDNSSTQKYNGKTKRITEITDGYIKNLESYLRSTSTETRRMGINQIIKLCEESTDRYDNPAIIALINIALQDSDRLNRIYAMTPLAVGTLNGDDNTIKLLQNLAKLDDNDQEAKTNIRRQQEAEMANDALLAISRKTIEVPDYSVPKQKE